MRKLFFRFYLSVLAVLFLAWWIHGYVWTSRTNSDRNRVIVTAHGGGARLMAAELNAARPEDRESTVEQIRCKFLYPVDLVQFSELPPSIRHTIANGSDVQTLRLTPTREFVVTALEDGQTALRFGPFPDYSGIEIEDSLSGWVRLAAEKIDAQPEPHKACEELQPLFALPIVIIDRQDLPEEARARIARGREVVFYSPDGNRYYAASPLAKDGEFLRLGPFPSFERIVEKAAATTLGLVLLPVAIAIAYLLRPISRQLRQVENAAKRIASGELSTRVDERQIGAARPLAQAFNNMAVRTEKLVESQRELLEAVSHELRTPLSRIRFGIALIETAKDNEERSQRLKSLETATEELDDLVAELLNYVRLDTMQTDFPREHISVAEALEQIIPKAKDLKANIAVDYQLGKSNEEHFVDADRLGFQRAIGNLLNNAVRHARQGVSINVLSSDSQIIIDVDDDGLGIPESERDRVLEPFVRLDSPSANDHRGVGLGLALVKRIVGNHGGSIAISTSPIGGCRIRTIWPKSPAPV
jgi:two-component system, OmpR family, sensor histidine kinase RstB